MEISREYSKMIFEDALESIRNPHHPCHHFYLWQTRNGYVPYQLPEPFSGKRASLGIAFIGLNPSITTDQVIPCADDTMRFDDFDRYYRERFSDANRDEKGKIFIRRTDGSTMKPRLWNCMENFANRFLQPLSRGVFKLGEHAILSQAVRYKSKNGWLGGTRAEQQRTLAHERAFVRSLIENEGIDILVPMGNHASAIIASVANIDGKVPARINQAMGNRYEGETDRGKRVMVCPIKHLSYPPGREAQQEVAARIIEAWEILRR